jgi:RNA polymerase sigma-70 factor (ECF subfamily)
MALAGNQDAYTALYREALPNVRRLMFSMFGNDEEDMTQECFAHIFKKLNKFDGRSRFSTWAYRVALNVGLTTKRKKRLGQVSIEVGIAEEGLKVSDTLLSHDERLEQADNRLDLVRSIAKLPKKQRYHVIRYYAHGYTANEIADEIGCVVGTAKSCLHHARKNLRRELL